MRRSGAPLLVGHPGEDVDADGTWDRNARWAKVGRKAAASAATSASGIAQGVAEDGCEARRQFALDLAPGGGRGELVELVEQARDRVRALGVEFDGLVRPRAEEERPELVRREHVDDLVGGRAAALRRGHLAAADVQELVGDVDRRLAIEDLTGDGVGAIPRPAGRREVLAAGLDRDPEQAPLGRPLEVPGELGAARRTGPPSRRCRSRGPR